MKASRIDTLPAGDRALLWKPRDLDGISLFRARFHKFAYKKHCHREYAIGVIEQGAQKFHHMGTSYTAPENTIICVNPDEAHDGMPGSAEGYQYHMAYIPRSKIREILTCNSKIQTHPGYFPRPTAADAQVAALFHRAFALMDMDGRNSLESHSCMAQALRLLFHRYANRQRPFGRGAGDRRVVAWALEYIRERASEDITLKEISASVGLSQYHFLRLFKEATGLPPHAYLIQMRVSLAKTAIEQGFSLADAASAAGFSDQSHMTRCFKAVHGLPPGRYKKQLFFETAILFKTPPCLILHDGDLTQPAFPTRKRTII